MNNDVFDLKYNGLKKKTKKSSNLHQAIAVTDKSGQKIHKKLSDQICYL